jgi:hypothetical protein
MIFQMLQCGECYENVYALKKAYKLSIAQHLEHSPHSNIWNIIVKLFWNTLHY